MVLVRLHQSVHEILTSFHPKCSCLLFNLSNLFGARITNSPIADVFIIWANCEDKRIRGFILEKVCSNNYPLFRLSIESNMTVLSNTVLAALKSTHPSDAPSFCLVLSGNEGTVSSKD